MKNILALIMSMLMLSSVAFAAPVEQGLSKKEIMELLVQTRNSAESEAHLALIDQAINKITLASDADLDAINTAILQNQEVAGRTSANLTICGDYRGDSFGVCGGIFAIVLLVLIT